MLPYFMGRYGYWVWWQFFILLSHLTHPPLTKPLMPSLQLTQQYSEFIILNYEHNGWRELSLFDRHNLGVRYVYPLTPFSCLYVSISTKETSERHFTHCPFGSYTIQFYYNWELEGL